MKRIIILLLVVLISFTYLSSCKKKEEVDNSKTIVTMTAAYDLTEFEKAFETANPTIDLQVEKLATAVINGEVTRRLRNNHGSDLIITNLPAGEIANYTYDLSAESFVESYQASMTNSIKVNGENRYLPLPGAYYGYIINKTLLDELQLSLPETKNDLLNILKVSKDNGIGISTDTGCGFGFSDAGSTFIGAYFAAEFATDYLSTADGVRWIAKYEAKTATFSNVWNDSVNFIDSCVKQGYMDKNKIIINYNGHMESNANAFKAEENLANRTAILTYGNIDMYKTIQARTQDEIVMLPLLPTTSSGNKLISAVSNDYIAVNKAIENDSKKLNAALRVLAYLSTTEGQNKWIEDTSSYHSYLNGYDEDESKLPESIRSYVENQMIFTNPFPTNLLSYLGKNLASVVKGSETIEQALTDIDDYYLNGSEDIEYDMSVVGTVAADMLYVNSNTRKEETELGNLISDAIREMSGADVALANGGGIRSSLYKGDVTGDDLTYVCPYGNLIIVAEMDGKTLREAITNGIQKTWKPSGQFLQVSGIKYSFKPANNETETAVLLSLTYADGKEVKDEDIITVAYTNFMGGSSGYIDAGDGYLMLNVYDETNPIKVRLVKETNKTYCDALKEYFANHKNEEIKASIEGRIVIQTNIEG